MFMKSSYTVTLKNFEEIIQKKNPLSEEDINKINFFSNNYQAELRAQNLEKLSNLIVNISKCLTNVESSSSEDGTKKNIREKLLIVLNSAAIILEAKAVELKPEEPKLSPSRFSYKN